ncbi:MAG: hypothetical protein KDJ27_04520 [Gammaproteobacteria bacterium]|nr:hypothetical protein [Gammaproteobacteria bacterium]
MNTRRLTAVGAFLGSLLVASATVTALSVTGTLQLRSHVDGSSAAPSLDGARLTLNVAPGLVDDDDRSELTYTTLVDPGRERRELLIAGEGFPDGVEADFVAGSASSLERREDGDHLLIGESWFRLDDDGGMLRLTGIDLALPLANLLDGDGLADIGLPAGGPSDRGSRGPKPDDGDAEPQLVVIGDDDVPAVVYAVTDIEAFTGDDGGDKGPGAAPGGEKPSTTAQGGPGAGSDQGGPPAPPGGRSQPLAVVGPDLLSTPPGEPAPVPQQRTALVSPTPPTEIPIPTVWLLLLGALPGLMRRRPGAR